MANNNKPKDKEWFAGVTVKDRDKWLILGLLQIICIMIGQVLLYDSSGNLYPCSEVNYPIATIWMIIYTCSTIYFGYMCIKNSNTIIKTL